MLSALPIFLAAAAAQPAAEQATEAAAAQYGPALPAVPKPKVVPAAAAVDPCKPVETKDVKGDTQEIVVCAPRVEGYRIDPDVLEAQRIKKNLVKRRRPERLVDTSCQAVGPMGCRNGAGINLLAAAVTAATMIEKAVKGENVGEMFITDPQPDEYQLYKEAKAAREAKEAEQAAALKAKAAAQAAATAAPAPSAQ
ncbi:hypothetical protein [Sphingomonas daechungensis]